MSPYPGDVGAGADADADVDADAGAGFEDSGFFDGEDRFAGELLQFTAYGDGYGVFEEPRRDCEDEYEHEHEHEHEGGVFFDEAFGRRSDYGDVVTTCEEADGDESDGSAVCLAKSLDEGGIDMLNGLLVAAAATLTPDDYTPHPHILANQPVSPPDLNALYAPLTISRFRSSAEAKAHRKRARLAPKSHAKDIARVKAFGRDYWVCRIFNAMINSQDITDGSKSIHRTRFTRATAFDALDLEAAAHAVFDGAIAVHERGWSKPTVYHKNTVRGRLVDISGASVELRLSRICLVLKETKSAVDDAVRGGVTLALLCDNPEARRFTKESNNLGNQKRGERLKQTAAKERTREAPGAQDGEEVEEVESREQLDAQETE